MEGGRLTVDTLFLACTRPAMWRGVPLQAVALIGMMTTVVVVILKNPLYGVLGVAMHYVTRALISRDYHFFGVLWLWADTQARNSRSWDRWGGSSISPMPLFPARKPGDIRVHA